MIKCNVTVNGVVSKAASCRTNREGKPFVTFGLQIIIPANDGRNKTVEMNVVKDSTLIEANTPPVGTRMEVTGVLTLKKPGESLYFNLSATAIDTAPTSDKDGISGEIIFRGKTGKTIEDKTDKNGKPYQLFSAFSTEKVTDGFEYIWVRFIRFDKQKEEWLQPATPIDAKGGLELSVYNDKISLTCRISELSPYLKPPFQSKK